MALQENGMTLTAHAAGLGVQFVPADIVAKLAGVSLSTAREVIAALDVISDSLGIVNSAKALLQTENLPSALPDEARSDSTRRVFAYIVSKADTLTEDQRANVKALRQLKVYKGQRRA